MKKLCDGSHMKCSLCGRGGHTICFCPSRVTTPLSADRCEFVDALIHSARVRLDIYKELTWEQVLGKFLMEGARLNNGNPWASEEGPEFHLKKLGLLEGVRGRQDSDELDWVRSGCKFCGNTSTGTVREQQTDFGEIRELYR